MFQKRGLHRMKAVAVGQAFDGRHLGPVMAERQREAGVDAASVNQNGAGPALAAIAALLGARQPDAFAQNVEKGRAGIVEGDLSRSSVDREVQGLCHLSLFGDKLMGKPGGSDRWDSYTEDASALQGRREVEQDMGEEPPKARKPRADQLRNRDRLLTAARDVFRADGASLDAVARKAGLGIGTLYRHFPTREALYQAVYAREVEELVQLASRLDSDGLGFWMEAGLQMMATKKGMIAALAPVIDADAPFYSEQSGRIRAAVAGLHDRAIAAGSVRPDVTPEDLMRVLIGLSYGPGADPARAGVLLGVFLDGLDPRR